MLKKIRIHKHDQFVWLLETLTATFQCSIDAKIVHENGTRAIPVLSFGMGGASEIDYDLKAVSSHGQEAMAGTETPLLKAAIAAINALSKDKEVPNFGSPAYSDEGYLAFGWDAGYQRDISERLQRCENDWQAIDDAVTRFGSSLKEVLRVDARENRVVSEVWSRGDRDDAAVIADLSELLDRDDILAITPAVT